jgi:flagellar biosynthetic protein FliR
VGLRFAAPVIATVMVVIAALAVLSRATPQLNILSVAFPLQIGLGLFALGIALPFIASTLGNWPTAYDQQLTSFFTAIAPAGMH